MFRRADVRSTLRIYGVPVLLGLAVQLVWMVLKRYVFISWAHLDGGEEALFSFAPTVLTLTPLIVLASRMFLTESGENGKDGVAFGLAFAALLQMCCVGWSLNGPRDVGFWWVFGYGVAGLLALLCSACWIHQKPEPGPVLHG